MIAGACVAAPVFCACAGAWTPYPAASDGRLSEGGVSNQVPTNGRRTAIAHFAAAVAAVGTGLPSEAREYVGLEDLEEDMEDPVRRKNRKGKVFTREDQFDPELCGPNGCAMPVREFPMVSDQTTITTPGGLEYTRTLLPTLNGTQKDRIIGPPQDGSQVLIKYTGRLDSFDGPIFDSSYLRGLRRPLPSCLSSYTECARQKEALRGSFNRLSVVVGKDKTLPPGLMEALKVMQVGEQGRFEMPPRFNYFGGQTAYAAHPDAKVKQVPAGATTFYTVELLVINRL